eukprot:13289518-Heterocapsa_arctica.AAC.1
MHDRSDCLWRTHMDYDIDESELEKFKKQALDKTEWGGFEQIVMWTRIYCIKIEYTATVWTRRPFVGMNSSKTKS